jgi:hypothetical protein
VFLVAKSKMVVLAFAKRLQEAKWAFWWFAKCLQGSKWVFCGLQSACKVQNGDFLCILLLCQSSPHKPAQKNCKK